MIKTYYILLMFLIAIASISCTKWHDGKYTVEQSGATTCFDLYRDIDDSAMIGRVSCVDKLWSDENFILIHSKKSQWSQQAYWILDKRKDGKYLNGL